MSDHRRNTAPAIEAQKTYAAERWAADPAKLDRCVRTVQAALEQGLLTLADIGAEAGNGSAAR